MTIIPQQHCNGTKVDPFVVGGVSTDRANHLVAFDGHVSSWDSVASDFKFRMWQESHQEAGVESVLGRLDRTYPLTFDRFSNQPISENGNMHASAHASISGMMIIDLRLDVGPTGDKEMAVRFHPQGLHVMLMLATTVRGSVAKFFSSTTPDLEIALLQNRHLQSFVQARMLTWVFASRLPPLKDPEQHPLA